MLAESRINAFAIEQTANRDELQHIFNKVHFSSLTYCLRCKNFIFGIGKQGYLCVGEFARPLTRISCFSPSHSLIRQNAVSLCTRNA
jgi:hypothetical protein